MSSHPYLLFSRGAVDLEIVELAAVAVSLAGDAELWAIVRTARTTQSSKASRLVLDIVSGVAVVEASQVVTTACRREPVGPEGPGILLVVEIEKQIA